MRILLVSNDEHVREEVRFGFPSDVEIVSAHDAREAVKALTDRPDLAIVDLRSGSAGGYAMALELSFTSEMRGVPILMLLEREQDAWLAEQAGAKLVRVKPIDTEALVEDALSLTEQPS